MGPKLAGYKWRKAAAVCLMLTGGLFTALYLCALAGLSSAISIFPGQSLASLLLRGLRFLIAHPDNGLAWVVAVSLLWPIPVFITGVALFPWGDFRASRRHAPALRGLRKDETEDAWPPPPEIAPLNMPPALDSPQQSDRT